MKVSNTQFELHFRHLTVFEAKCICNGCGGKGGKINPPEFLFNASCNQHDFYYWRGGNEIDRYKADRMFFDKMKNDTKLSTNPLKRMFYLTMAYIYFKAVRKKGKSFFNYTNSPKNKDDLIQYIKEERKNIIKGKNNGTV